MNCLVESENLDMLVEAICRIYDWSQQKWKVQYPLTDNSAIERAAVRKAFGSTGYIKDHLLYTVHTERTL